MWEIQEGKLQREFMFSNFDGAIEFILKVQTLANTLNHHPDILIHSYNKVCIFLVTHDTGNTLSDLDYRFAEDLDKII